MTDRYDAPDRTDRALTLMRSPQSANVIMSTVAHDSPLPPHPQPYARGVYELPLAWAEGHRLIVAIASNGHPVFQREVGTTGDREVANNEAWETLRTCDPLPGVVPINHAAG